MGDKMVSEEKGTIGRWRFSIWRMNAKANVILSKRAKSTIQTVHHTPHNVYEQSSKLSTKNNRIECKKG